MIKFRVLLVFALLVVTKFSLFAQPTFTFSNIDTFPGSLICIDVMVEDFTDITGFQYTISWDPSVLEFESTGNYNLDFLAAGNFGQGDVANGNLGVLWFDAVTNGVTVPDSTVIFQVCFSVVGNSGENTDIDITDNNVSIEVTDINNGSPGIGLNQNGGVINVIGPNFLEVIFDENVVDENESFCMDILVVGFDSITSFQTSFAWDQTVISFDSLSNFNLPGFSAANFNLTNANNGSISMLWSSPNGQAASIPDDSILVSLCFTAVGASCESTPLEFASSPVNISVSSSLPGFTIVDPTDGRVGVANPLTVYTTDEDVFPNETVCVDVGVIDFSCVLSLQYTLAWDPTVLEFQSLNNFNLQYLDNSVFGTTNVNNGMLTLSWFDLDFSGEELPDSTIIFEICFDAIGTEGDETPVYVSDSPTTIEVVNTNGDNSGLNADTGIVRIKNVILVIDTLIANVDCYDLDGGSINLTVDGGQPPYNFIWDTPDGDTTEDIDSLTNGTYTVTITDSANPIHTTVASFKIEGDFDAPEADVGPDTTVNDCFAFPILLEGTGSVGPNYVYDWVTTQGQIISGDSTLSATVGLPGKYTLIVTDTTNGCGAGDSLTIIGNFTVPVADAGAEKEITCASSFALLDGTSSSTGNDLVYVWTANPGNIVNGSSTTTPLVDTAGLYTLTVTDTLSGCSNSDEVVVAENLFIAGGSAGPDTVLTCDVNEVLLNGESPGNFNYLPQWYTIGGNIVEGAETLQPLVDQGGTYCMIIFNIDNGCSDTSCLEVTYDTIPPVVDPGPQGFIDCQNNTFQIQATNSSSGPDFEISWSTDNGNIISGENTLTPVVDTAGVYELTILNTDNGCEASDTISVTEDPNIPQANAGSDTTLTCIRDTVILDGTGSPTGAQFTYQWEVVPGSGGNIVNGANTLTPLVDAAGIYQLIITDNNNNCSGATSVTVINDTIPPVADAGPDKIINCGMTNVVLDGDGSTQGDHIVYQWTTDDGNFIDNTDTSIFASVNIAADYTLTVLNTETGCMSEDEVTVTQSPDLPTSNAGTATSLTCTDSIIMLDGTASSQGSNIAYFWSSPGGMGFVTQMDSVEVGVNLPGTYTLVVTNTDNNCFSISTVDVGLDTVQPVITLPDTNQVDCFNPELGIFIQVDSVDNPSFEWSTMTGNIISGEDTSEPLVNQGGTYEVIVTNDENGCTAVASIEVDEDTETPEALGEEGEQLDCDVSQVTLDASATVLGPDVVFEWADVTNFISGANTLMPATETPGDYELIVTDTTNGCADTLIVMVAQDTIAPVADAGDPGEINCTDDQINLDGSESSSGMEILYDWSTLDGNIVSGENTSSPLVNVEGTYELVVIDTSNGCSSIAQVNVMIDTIAPNAFAGTGFDLGCELDPVSLDGTGSSTGTDIQYEWTTVDGTIIDGNNSLDPLVDGPGTYLLSVTDTSNGCAATASIDVTQDLDLEEAVASEDVFFCDGSNDSIALTANLPIGTTGNWSSPTGGAATDPSSNITNAEKLSGGDNIFIWTLSTDVCPAYDQDTIIITLEVAPSTVNDALEVPFGPRPHELDVTINDDVEELSEWTLSILPDNQPGTLESVGDGVVVFNTPDNFSGELFYQYAICNDFCPDLCDTSQIVFLVQERPLIDPDSLTDLINTITPNGDGVNEVLAFEFLETNPDQFPNVELVVFNRWGNIVWEQKPYTNDWGGTNKNGQELPQGTYYYILRLNVPGGNIFRGDITILK